MYATVTYNHHPFERDGFRLVIADNGRVHAHFNDPTIYLSWDNEDEAWEFGHAILDGIVQAKKEKPQ